MDAHLRAHAARALDGEPTVVMLDDAEHDREA
jgi:hypothetical protein